MLGVFVFADSFKSIRMSLHEDDVKVRDKDHMTDVNDFESFKKVWLGEFIQGFRTSFYTALGGFTTIDVDQYYDMQWFIFLICCLVNVILLLNLLIALISNIFDDVKETEKETVYQLLCY